VQFSFVDIRCLVQSEYEYIHDSLVLVQAEGQVQWQLMHKQLMHEILLLYQLLHQLLTFQVHI